VSESRKSKCINLFPREKITASLESVRNFINVLGNQIEVDKEVWWPSMKAILSPEDWWTAFVTVSVQFLQQDAFKVIGKDRVPLNAELLDIMRALGMVALLFIRYSG
jgi:hypothetical protein